MPQRDFPGMRSLAWNGVWLQTPSEWEPVTLEKHYLKAAGKDALFVECKWQEGRSVSPGKALKRLKKATGDAELELDLAKLGGEMQRACSALQARGFEVQPFGWRMERDHGTGALLYCPQCRRTTLVQCSGKDEDPELSASIIGSFLDHVPDGSKSYTLFGIAARVPSGFSLKHFSFKPGQYRLELEGNKRRKKAGLVLERVGPANVLFERGQFFEWASQRFAAAGSKITPVSGVWQGGPAVMWDPKPTALKLMMGRLLLGARGIRIRAWQPDSANKVLCVALTGGGKQSLELFEEVCEGYVLA